MQVSTANLLLEYVTVEARDVKWKSFIMPLW